MVTSRIGYAQPVLTLVLTGILCVRLSQARTTAPTNLDRDPNTVAHRNVSRKLSGICPPGWSLAASPQTSFNYARKRQLCLHVHGVEEPWRAARQRCRNHKGFLLKLETILMVDNVLLFDYLRRKGFGTVWTGLHHQKGTLLWDELHPQMAKSYPGESQIFGWKRRGWRFDNESFRLGRNTCGALNIENDPWTSREVPGHRGKRSPLQSPGQRGPPLDGRVGGAGLTKVDNEDIQPSRAPIEEKKMESFQQFLTSQGFQEGYVESIGDPSPTDGANPGSLNLEVSTLSTTTTDQSNLEDDDYHVVTKRSVTLTTTPDPVSIMKSPNSETAAPQYSPQKSVKGTSLPVYTKPQTPAPPTASTNVDDILNQLLQASMFNVSKSSPLTGGSGDTPKFLPLPQIKSAVASIEGSQLSSESESLALDSNEYLKSLLRKATVTVPPMNSADNETKEAAPDILSRLLAGATSRISERTSTSQPKSHSSINTVLPSNFVFPGGWNEISDQTTISPALDTTRTTQTLVVQPTTLFTETVTRDISNSVLDFENSQAKDSKRFSKTEDEIVTPKSVTDILETVVANVLSKASDPSADKVSDTSTSNTTTVDTEDSKEKVDSAASLESATTQSSKSTESTTTDTNSGEVGGARPETTTEQPNQSLDLDLQSTPQNDSTQADSVVSKDTFTSKENPDLLQTDPNRDSPLIPDERPGTSDSGQGMTEANSSPEETVLTEEKAENVNSPGVTAESNPGPNMQNGEIYTESGSSDGDSSQEIDVPPPGDQNEAPSNEIELDYCDEDHPSVCVTEAIEELSLVGHCDRNWYGHRLLDRCYRPLGFTLTELEARQRCLRYSASLATADTGFYGNITALLLDYFTEERAFDKRIWVDTTLNLDIPVDGQCSALEDGQLYRVDCGERLPFICQKDAHSYSSNFNTFPEAETTMTFVQNMTSFHPQTLWCPLTMSSFDDIILWYKDGRPIMDQLTDDGRTSFGFKNGHMPNRLQLDLSILERVGEGGARIPKPAMMQGEYWCEIWRREPFHRVVSNKIFLKFTDVITLRGHIITAPTDYISAARFNRMGHVSGLPAIIERHLATLNKNVTHVLRDVFPIVRDVISFVKHISPNDGKTEFITYICTSSDHMNPHLRGNMADLYLSTFYEALVQHEDEIRADWNLSLPIRQAISVSMTDMCPEANLIDKQTRLSATFPITPINNRALSRDFCDGIHSGSAWCRGDQQTGAYWDTWRVTGSCYHEDQRLTSSSEDSDDDDANTFGVDGEDSRKRDDDDVADVGDGFVLGKPPNSALLELDEVEIEPDNVADVTERLADVLDQADELSDSDIETVSQVVTRIVSVRKPPAEVSDKLMKTVNKVLDAPPAELRKAERKSKASSRLLANLENFGAKVDMGADPRIRMVTPNVAMELWNLEDSNDVVIGFGATETPTWSAPLSEPRILTIKDRSWAQQHLSTFDVAIELPGSLVKNTVRYSDSSLRLSMFIYRKTGLFMQDDNNDDDGGDDNNVDDSTEGSDSMINSAVISASLGGRRIRGLEDKVRLVFRPFQEVQDHEDATRCVFWDTESSSKAKWSDAGCVYNGTINGRDICLCDHLTNFAILLDLYGDKPPYSPEHETSLSVLSLIGISLSIFGLSITIITFLAFKKLRHGRAQQTLFNMAIALLCFQTTFLVGIKQTSTVPVCLAVAILLHYFILVSFAWMLIEAVLQYLTFVKVLGTYISRYTLKTVLPAWGVPLLPVIAVLATDYNLYLGRTNYCWMDLQAFYYAFALPVGIIIVFNIVMFCVIIVSLVTRPKGLRSHQANNKTRETNLKAAFTIFILLGLTWLFGYLAIEDARLPFQYAFTVLSSLQGFLIFILMVARRRQVRDQWEAMCCWGRKDKRKGQKRLSPTLSSSTNSNNSLSNSRTMPSFINHAYSRDSVILPSHFSTGLRRQSSMNV